MLIKRLSIAAGLFFALAVIILSVVHITASNPQKVCDKFINLVTNGDISGSYNLFTDGARKSVTLNSWAGQVNGQRPYYTHNLKLSNVEDTSKPGTSNQSLTLKYSMSGKNGQPINLTCFAVKSNKKYLVDGFTNQ